MTNKDRQRSLDKSREKRLGTRYACGCDNYCDYCTMDDDTPCAKAYNRMIRGENKPRKAKPQPVRPIKGQIGFNL